MGPIHYSGLMSWVKAKDEELLRAEAVAGTPERVSAQISEVDVSSIYSGTSDKGPSEIGTTSLQRTLVLAPC